MYNNLSSYFRKKYGRRVKKICIDGGFSCPNRDGKAGFGGCIFCAERGSGEHIEKGLSIKEQVEKALAVSYDDDIFVAYFQNFTNTYADIKTLKERYDSALISEKIKVLAIGTRPDCIDSEIASLIASYKERVDVWVELGLQTADDETAKIINRGYTSEVFEKAVKTLNEYGIPVVCHIMIGLPGEDMQSLVKTVEFINRQKIFGVKIHSVYIMKNTVLEKMYLSGSYTPISMEQYAKMAAYAISSLREDIVIHRITGDCPKDLLVAPEWNRNKNEVIRLINAELEKINANKG